MKKYPIYVILFWLALGIFVSAYSYFKLGLGKLHNPGPGLMPFLLGLLFSIISFYLLMSSLFKRDKEEETLKEEQRQIYFRKVILVLASLFFYGLFLETLGFLIVTLITMTILFWTMGFVRWRSLGVASCLTVLVTYFLFTYLGVRFPAGILRSIGMY
jgi:putative tricarboxylic transport membrane protein